MQVGPIFLGVLVRLSQSCPGITYDSIEAAHVGYCYGDSTTGQVLVTSQGNL